VPPETSPPRAADSAQDGEPRRGRIGALIHLLGDEEPGIYRAAWHELFRLGEACIPAVESACTSSNDPAVRRRCVDFLLEWQRRAVFERWIEFCSARAHDLETGALLIAASESPDLDVDAVRVTLDRAARGLARRIATARTTDAAVAALARCVHHDLGLVANREDYHDDANSYINRVLERRLGIPISLAAVYLLIARRLSVPLEGVGMPCHFLLKFLAHDGGRVVDRFVDPFAEGARLGTRDCARFLEEHGIPFRESYLRAVSDTAILQRMLGNLLRIYHDRGDERREGRIASMLQLLQG